MPPSPQIAGCRCSMRSNLPSAPSSFVQPCPTAVKPQAAPPPSNLKWRKQNESDGLGTAWTANKWCEASSSTRPLSPLFPERFTFGQMGTVSPSASSLIRPRVQMSCACTQAEVSGDAVGRSGAIEPKRGATGQPVEILRAKRFTGSGQRLNGVE